MKIYTKTGDDGSTGLIGGTRVSKGDPRIQCVGAVDELNASLGVAAATAGQEQQRSIRQVQNDLFVIGSHLAAPDGVTAAVPALDESIVARLEMVIDTLTERLPPLREFILPGGGETSARLHLARTVCRRAERMIVGFAHDRPVPPLIVTFLNRLADWLFMQARWANHCEKIPDVKWEKEGTEARRHGGTKE